MGDRLATRGMDPKWEEAAVGAGFPLGPHLTQCGLGRGLPLYQVASWSIQPFGHDCRNATLLRVGIHLRTIFIPSLVVKTFTVRVHWFIAKFTVLYVIVVMWGRYCGLTSFFPIVDTCLSCEEMARQICAMVPRWRFFASCIYSEPRAARFRPAS